MFEAANSLVADMKSLTEPLRCPIICLRDIATQTNAKIGSGMRVAGAKAKALLACAKRLVPSRRAIGSLLGVAVGFGLATSWDLWKTHRDHQSELFRAARTISQELTGDSEVMKLDIEYLETDMAAGQSHREMVLPMENVVTVAGDTAYLKGSLDYQSVELSIELRTIYSSLSSINRRIEQREFYRMTNGAMSNYDTRRSVIDAALKDELVAQTKAVDSFIRELKKAHLVE